MNLVLLTDSCSCHMKVGRKHALCGHVGQQRVIANVYLCNHQLYHNLTVTFLCAGKGFATSDQII